MELEPVENKNIETVQKDQATETPIQETETIEQINWKKFREQREIERKQKEAAERLAHEKQAEAEALKAAMEAILNKNPSSNGDRDRNYSDEDLTDEQKIDKRVQEALDKREKQYEQQRLQREQQEFPTKLNQAYKDFNQVCTTENLDYLEYHYPEIAKAFRYAPDGFEKWSNVYHAVKRFVPNSDSKKDQGKAEKNFNKPQSMAVAGVTQTGDSSPIQLDEKRRADNWSRMQRVMKGGK